MVTLLTKLFDVKYDNLYKYQTENKEYPSWTAARSKPVGKICVFSSYFPLQLFNIYIYIYKYIICIYIYIICIYMYI